MERSALVFLVRRMDRVVVEAETDHQAVHAQFALERADDRNRAAGAYQNRRLAPFGLERAARDAQRLAAHRERQRRASAMRDELGSHVGGQARLDEGAERLRDPLGILFADDPERNLRARLGW